MSKSSAPIDPLALTEALIAAPSVTPATGEVFDVLHRALAGIDFTVERFVDGGPPDGPVENLLATRVNGAGPHIAFAGHLDVVPPGEGWTSDPFTPTRRGDLLHGRGAVDMKGAIAAFVAAAAETAALPGTVSLIVTGDEEGAATHGTVALMAHMAERGLVPDLCLVGEPTSVARLGDTVKIGRRGSVNMWIGVGGSQGHVAYPHLADNPVPRLVRILSAIDAVVLDKGTDWFQPSNIEITDIHVGNATTNLIPGRATARISVRFNDLHRGDALVERICGIVEAEGGTLTAKISGEAFLSRPGPLSDMIAASIESVTGLSPELSTSGGTSDARFLCQMCPVIEFGLNNGTMHKLDEAVALNDLRDLARIYADFLQRALGGDAAAR